MSKIRTRTPTATVTRRDVVIGSAGIAFLATVAIHAAGNPTTSDGDFNDSVSRRPFDEHSENERRR